MKVYVPIPKGFHMPEGTKDGDTVDLMGEFRVEGARLCLLTLEDTPMDGDAKSEEDEYATNPGKSKFMDSYRRGMGIGEPDTSAIMS